MCTMTPSDVVDIVAVDPAGVIVLFLLDDLSWADSKCHVEALQAKLNFYLSFVESGEIFEREELAGPRSLVRGSPVRIHVIAKEAAPPSVGSFFDYVRHEIEGANFQFIHEVREE